MFVPKVFIRLSMFINLLTMCKAEIKVLGNPIKLITQVRHLYHSADIILVHNESESGWRERGARAVRAMSQLNLMSQSVSRTQLTEAPDRIIKSMHITSSMVVMELTGPQDFDFLRRIMSFRGDSIHAWVMLAQGSNCESPSGNPLGLKINSQFIVHCANSSTLRRYYSLEGRETEVADVGTWSAETGLNVTDKSELYCMKNLKNLTLRIAKAVHMNSSIDYYYAKNNFAEQLLKELKRVGNFSDDAVVKVSFKRSVDRIVKAVKNEEVDIGLFLVAITARRKKFFDFAIPVAESHYRIYARLDAEPTIPWSAYLRVFNTIEWIYVLLTIVFSMAMWMIIKSLVRKTSLTSKSIIDSTMDVWGIFCQKSLIKPEILTHLSIRIFYVAIMLSSSIIYNIYSATITSYITVLKPSLPFSNYDEFFNNTDYKLISLRYSVTEYFSDKNFWLHKAVQSRLEDMDKLPDDVHEGVERICYQNVAMAVNYLYFKGGVNQIPCYLGYIKIPLLERISIILPKNSPYTDIISYNILRLYDTGVIKRLKHIYFYEHINPAKKEPILLSFGEFLPILAVWLVGLVVSLIILYSELVFYKWQRRHHRRFVSKRRILHRLL